MQRTIILLTAALTMISAACSAEAPGSGLRPFWAQFRQAMIDNDKAAIASMARFPFEVLGVDDSDPVQSLDQKGFLGIYERLVVQAVYVPSDGQIVPKSMRELIYDQTDAPATDSQGGDTMRYQQFEFERVAGRWLFVRAYLEE